MLLERQIITQEDIVIIIIIIKVKIQTLKAFIIKIQTLTSYFF
jgi:hypothetical protein